MVRRSIAERRPAHRPIHIWWSIAHDTYQITPHCATFSAACYGVEIAATEQLNGRPLARKNRLEIPLRVLRGDYQLGAIDQGEELCRRPDARALNGE